GNGHGLTDFGALTGIKSHGNQAEHGGQRGHQDRPQADQTGLNHGLALGHAPAAQMVDVVHQDDGVVDDDAGEGDPADEHDDADVNAHRLQGVHHADESEGYAEHDQRRMQNRFELAGHDDVYEEN